MFGRKRFTRPGRKEGQKRVHGVGFTGALRGKPPKVRQETLRLVVGLEAFEREKNRSTDRGSVDN